jgi:hypothetical protein
VEATVAAGLTRACAIRFHHGEKVEAVAAGGQAVGFQAAEDGARVTFQAEAGKAYQVRFRP